MIATTRIALPHTKVRLSAGRTQITPEGQALCYFAGANSIFYGSKLLTADNPRENEDMRLLEKLGLRQMEPKTSCMHDAQRAATSAVA
jgi:biotin synthase